ncbi:hypothetical protein [Bacillus toyonensis]|uniref:hypothetical protein n=1 Tax=Bacillus toyonensis TaxID=155322 RepID=UPI002E1C3BAF|nr:hypothetical protein [Bacillus toyonensis]
MYADASTYQQYINLTWDLIVVALLIIAVLKPVGSMLLSTGYSLHYVEKYFVTLAASIFSYQFIFSFLFYTGHTGAIRLFNFKIMNLDYLVANGFMDKIVLFASSSFFLFIFFMLYTVPFMALYNRFILKSDALRFNHQMTPMYTRNLMCILAVTSIPSLFLTF